ncbi:hypothetical protein ACIOWN_33085, partial [Streptomyces sp. NPDC087787]
MRIDDPGKDGVRITSLTLPSVAPSPTRSYSGSADGLTTGSDSGISAAYEVANESTEPLTYTVIFTFLTSSPALRRGIPTARAVGFPASSPTARPECS